jgi:hypothetical protein
MTLHVFGILIPQTPLATSSPRFENLGYPRNVRLQSSQFMT